MSNPNVYEVAHLMDADGALIRFGVDYDFVTINCGRVGTGGGFRLNRAQAELFAQYLVHACWEAASGGYEPFVASSGERTVAVSDPVRPRASCGRCERTATVRVVVRGTSGRNLIEEPLCPIHETAEKRMAGFGMAAVEFLPLISDDENSRDEDGAPLEGFVSDPSGISGPGVHGGV